MKKILPASLLFLLIGLLIGSFLSYTFFPRIKHETKVVEKTMKPATTQSVTEKYEAYTKQVKQFEKSFKVDGFSMDRENSDTGSHVLFISPTLTFQHKKCLTITGEDFTKESKSQPTESTYYYQGDKGELRLSLIYRESDTPTEFQGLIGSNWETKIKGTKNMIESSLYSNKNLLVLSQFIEGQGSQFEKDNEKIQRAVIEALKRMEED